MRIGGRRDTELEKGQEKRLKKVVRGRSCKRGVFIQEYEVSDLAVGWCFAFEPPGKAIVRVRNPKRLALKIWVGFAMEADG